MRGVAQASQSWRAVAVLARALLLAPTTAAMPLEQRLQVCPPLSTPRICRGLAATTTTRPSVSLSLSLSLSLCVHVPSVGVWVTR
jgi:hypothetical protein